MGATLIALLDGQARIAGAFTLGAGTRKWNVRTEIAYQLIGRANLRVAEIPSRIGSERHRNLRHADPRPLVPIAVNLRNEDREWPADARRLFTDNALRKLWPVIDTVGFVNRLRELDPWQLGKLNRLQAHQRAICNTRIL